MQTELNEIRDRYDDLLLLSSTRSITDAEASELYAIEERIRQIVFPIPHRADFTDQEWADWWPAEEAARIAFDNAAFCL